MANRASKLLFSLPRNRVYPQCKQWQVFPFKTVLFQTCAGKFLFVEDWAQDGNGEMGKIGSPFVELQPPHHTMVGEVLCYFCLRDSEVFREPWFDRIRAAATAAPYQVACRNPEGLAGFHVIVGGQVGIREHEDAGSRGSTIRLVQLGGRTSEQAAKLHFQQGDS